MKRILSIIIFSLMAGCSAIPPERLAMPVLDYSEATETPVIDAIQQFQADTEKLVNKRIYGFQGYPNWAYSHNMEGTVEVKVTSYGSGHYKVDLVANSGDDIFKAYALAYVTEAVHKVYMEKPLRAVNFSFNTVANFYLN